MKQFKICSKCKKLLSISEFNKNKKYIDGLTSYCKNCMKEYGKIYRFENKEKIKGKQKYYNSSRNLKLCDNIDLINYDEYNEYDEYDEYGESN
jgi:hypothetical protein